MTKIKPTILVVDDQENWRKLLGEILMGEFEVTAVASYKQALDKINASSMPYHLLITDMRLIDTELGNEHGLKLIEKLNKTSTKSIVITGYPTIKTMQKAAFGLKVAYYFEKVPSNGEPFDTNEFLKIVREATGNAKTNRKNKVRKNQIFVFMPFAEEFRVFYENEIKKTIENSGFSCIRADDFYGARRIISDIKDGIEESRLIIADLTGRNPNVFFEIGIAHALGKNMIFLVQDLKDVHPNLQTVRCLLYERSMAGAINLLPVLERAIGEILEVTRSPFFTTKEFEPLPRYCLALMPDDEISKQTYESIIIPALHENNCDGNRIDDLFNSFSVVDEIWARINAAEFIIADLSGYDANTFYLIGLAYGLGKKIIYVAQNETDIPFDLRDGSCLIYSTDPYEAGLQAKLKLTQLIKDILA